MAVHLTSIYLRWLDKPALGNIGLKLTGLKENDEVFGIATCYPILPAEKSSSMTVTKQELEMGKNVHIVSQYSSPSLLWKGVSDTGRMALQLRQGTVEIWVQFPALPETSCVKSGKSLITT